MSAELDGFQMRLLLTMVQKSTFFRGAYLVGARDMLLFLKLSDFSSLQLSSFFSL